jgi:small-conductance mechanosensitive channel
VTEQTLWRSLRRSREQARSPEQRQSREQRRNTPAAQERRASIFIAVLAGVIALGAVIIGSLFGNVRPPAHPAPGAESRIELMVVAWSSAVVFAVAGCVATRRAATLIGRLVARQTIAQAGVAVKLVTTIVGYLVVLFAALELLDVSLEHLLTDATLLGVVLGIAAQQSLGNLFAGLVLMVARPFKIGDHIRIRAGALGGIFDGVVLTQSLTYVTISTDDGLLRIPNSGMLAAAVGPFRPAPAPSVGPTTGQVPVTGITAVIPEPGTDTRPPAPLSPGREEGEGGERAGDGRYSDGHRPSPWRELAARQERSDSGGRRGGSPPGSPDAGGAG